MKKKMYASVIVILTIIFYSQSVMAGNQMINLNDNIIYNISFTGELGYYQYDLPDRLLDVKAHPHDSATGSTEVNLNDGWDINFKVNLRMYYPVSDFVSIGPGLDLGLSSAGAGGYRSGNYEVELSEYGGESYAYAEITSGWYILTPVISLVSGNVVFEVGFPYNEFHLDIGNDRYGEWDRLELYSWYGFGQRYSLGYTVFDEFLIGFAYETFQPEFDDQTAKIDSLRILAVYSFY